MINADRRQKLYIALVIAVILSAMLSGSFWQSAALAGENQPKKVLTVPPGTPRPLHTPTPFIQATATEIATVTPIAVTPTRIVGEEPNGDDVILVGLKLKQACVAENSGTLAVGLKLSQPSTQTMIVDVTSSNINTSNRSANVGQDFELIDSSVTFSSGQTDAVINISVVNDADEEGDETFLLEIQSIRDGAALIDSAHNSTEVIIWDDDDQKEDSSQYDCNQQVSPEQTAGRFDIQMDSANSQLNVDGVVHFDIIIQNLESYTLTDTVVEITIPIGMMLVGGGTDSEKNDTTFNPIDITWQQLSGQISTVALDGLAGEVQIQMRLGDILPNIVNKIPLLLRVGQDITPDGTTAIAGRLSAVRPDGKSWSRITRRNVPLAPTLLPTETEPIMWLFLPIVKETTSSKKWTE